MTTLGLVVKQQDGWSAKTGNVANIRVLLNASQLSPSEAQPLIDIAE